MLLTQGQTGTELMTSVKIKNPYTCGCLRHLCISLQIYTAHNLTVVSWLQLTSQMQPDYIYPFLPDPELCGSIPMALGLRKERYHINWLKTSQ